MACISHLKFSTEQKFLYKFVYKKSVGDFVTKLEAQDSRSKNKIKIIAHEVPQSAKLISSSFLPRTNAL